MKKLLVFTLSLICVLDLSAQIDSIYFYNPDGTKNWWYLQKDVVLFKCNNDSATTIQFDTTIVNQINFWNSDYRKFNELLISSSSTLQDLQNLKDTILNSAQFESFSPALTKYPLLTYNQERFVKTDDQILVTFNDPLIDDNTINNFMIDYGLALVHKPSNLLDNTKNWTYIFRVKPQEDTVFNSILIANLIFELEPTLVKISQPNVYSGDFLDCQVVSELGLTPGGINGLWNIQNDGGLIWNSQNGSNDADADICECWGEGYNGTGIKIGIIDMGGFQYNHPDLQTLQPGYKLYTNPIQQFNSNTYANPAIGHGMNVAGIIGATPNNTSSGERFAVGSAFGSEIYPYLLNSLNSADIVKGLQQAVIDEIDVLNMSFKVVYNSSIALQLDNCAQIGRPNPNSSNGYLGMVMVASVGNYDIQENNFPANHNSVIGVGMSNPNDYRSSSFAPVYSWTMNPGDGSTYGPPSFGYDVVAPGEILMTTDITGFDGTAAGDYIVSGGTSFSAPIVSSIAAILLEKNPNLSYTQIHDLIRNGAEKKNASFYNYNQYSNYPGYNDEMFYGRVSCINSINLEPLGLEENVTNSKLTVIRLSEESFLIYLPTDNSIHGIEIYNSVGQLIKTEELELNQKSIEFDLKNCSTGFYFVKLTDDLGRIRKAKILK